MIRKLIRQMLSAQIFSALAVSLCLLVDNIMIGRFLKEQAMAAYILANIRCCSPSGRSGRCFRRASR